LARLKGKQVASPSDERICPAPGPASPAIRGFMADARHAAGGRVVGARRNPPGAPSVVPHPASTVAPVVAAPAGDADGWVEVRRR